MDTGSSFVIPTEVIPVPTDGHADELDVLLRPVPVGPPETHGHQEAQPPEEITMLPYWRCPTEEHVYHSTTQLPDGRLSFIIDPGAWTNLIGKNLAHALASRAKEAMPGAPESVPMETPLHIAGVGNGTQSCHYKLKTPVALTTADGNTDVHTLTVPIVEGTGANLPGLLGLKSLEGLNAILDTGRRMLHFPGPDTQPLRLPEGTISIPLEKAPSGHLCMVVGDFHKLSAAAKGMTDPDSSLQLVSHEAASSSTRQSKPNEWNDFQAFYKDSGLNKETVNELYWDYKEMTKPDRRNLSETKRREEYQSMIGTDTFKDNKNRLNAITKDRRYKKPPAKKEPSPEPDGEEARGSGGARRLDLHCHV